MVLVLISITMAQAQRMLLRQKGLEISAGTLSDENSSRNYYLNIGLTINGRNGNYKLWALEYTHQYNSYKVLRIPQETYTTEYGYCFFLFGDTYKNITLNVAITGVLGYESINRGEALLYDGAKILSEDNFIYGAGGRLSLETYLTDYFVLLIQGRTKAVWGTDLEQFRPSVGVGIRFNF